jgi:hypothetical protein
MALECVKIEYLHENKLVKNVLLIKIIYTLIGIISYLFFPIGLIEYFEIGSIESIDFIRSLGFTYIGLLFVYSSGYFQIIKKNIYPINIVLFGIFMNGGAFIINIISILANWFIIFEFNVNIITFIMLILFFIIALLLSISLVKNYRKYKNNIIWNILWNK